jgi:hypothetical protein
MSRSFLIGVILALSAVLAAVVAASAFEAAQTGQVAVAKISLMGAAAACLVVLVGIYATNPAQPRLLPHCHNCGTKLYATLRSYDRREVLTCFACGSEWAAPPRAAATARGAAIPLTHE